MAARKRELKEWRVSAGVRLKPEIRDKLRELAAVRRWTISAYIEWVLEQHLEDLDAHPTKPPTSRTRS